MAGERTAKDAEPDDEPALPGKRAGKPRRARKEKGKEKGARKAKRRERKAGSRGALAPPVDYFARTRSLNVNLVFLMPWLLLYLVCWGWAGDAVETQAASWLRNGLRLLGHRALFVVTLVVALGLSAFVLTRLREAKKDAAVFPLMAAEGALYGLLLYGAGTVLSRFLPVGRWIGLYSAADVTRQVQALGTAVGAGIFEELVFRGGVCWALFHVLRDVLGADRWSSGILAVLASAALFSAYHHWGPGGEPWDAARFTFRMHAGALLGVVFLTRGLGIAAFAHGLYDALVLLG